MLKPLINKPPKIKPKESKTTLQPREESGRRPLRIWLINKAIVDIDKISSALPSGETSNKTNASRPKAERIAKPCPSGSANSGQIELEEPETPEEKSKIDDQTDRDPFYSNHPSATGYFSDPL